MSGRGVMGMLLLCLVAGMGCSDKNSVPRGILPKDKMERVMWDMAQADQYAALYLTKDSTHIDRKAETLRLYAEVFRLHQVDPEQFRKSYRYYLDHPELNQLLFDSVIARGVRARSEMYDRPSSQYHPSVVPANLKPGVVRPGAIMPGAGRPGGALVPGRPGVARPGVVVPVAPGRSVGGMRPGAMMQQAGGETELMRRMREASSRKQDSIMRGLHVKRDTTKGRP
jgi:hypothetical protein